MPACPGRQALLTKRKYLLAVLLQSQKRRLAASTPVLSEGGQGDPQRVEGV